MPDPWLIVIVLALAAACHGRARRVLASRRLAQLVELDLRDAHTGLPSRRALELRLDAEINRARRFGSTLRLVGWKFPSDEVAQVGGQIAGELQFPSATFGLADDIVAALLVSTGDQPAPPATRVPDASVALDLEASAADSIGTLTAQLQTGAAR